MKTLKQNIILHLSTVVMFGLLYPLFIAGIGLLFPKQSAGLPIEKNGKIIGYENIGQKFTKPGYFWSRPSAVDYNAAATGGSNKGPTNGEYLSVIKTRIEDFLKANPEIKREDIPADLVTASGGGLDPHISLQAALIQIPRIAKKRNIEPKQLKVLVYRNVEKPILGLFGPGNIVNVLQLNIQLNKIDR